uniref:Uncharacterized protein n=1 Tax=Anguilla anguilla TaxID=7936 RepID=A0A0E9UPF2_ANGAN
MHSVLFSIAGYLLSRKGWLSMRARHRYITGLCNTAGVEPLLPYNWIKCEVFS